MQILFFNIYSIYMYVNKYYRKLPIVTIMQLHKKLNIKQILQYLYSDI